MSAVSFPDLDIVSPNGRYRGEAKSPDNREIPGPDGKPADPTTFGYKYGQEQRTFRFRLRDHQGQLLWERWQPEREPSPVQLYLADDGWLVIRTHGDRLTYLVCISPAGVETIRVIVTDGCVYRPASETPPPGSPLVIASNANSSSAGLYWAWAALHFFFHYQNDCYFSMWPSWGERFAINLTQGQLHLHPSPEICQECQTLETSFAEKYLKSHDPYRDISRLLGVLGMIGRQRLERLIPLVLKCWRTKNYREQCTTGSHVLRGQQRTTLEPLPTMSLVLASMGRLEPGQTCYSLHPGWGRDNPSHLAAPKARCTQLANLNPGMDCAKVLRSVGCPDYIDTFTEPHDGIYRWAEQWDYYTEGTREIVRILWKPDSYGERMRSLERLPLSAATVDARLSVLLGG